MNVRQRKNPRKGALNNQASSWSFRLNGLLLNVSQEEVYQQVAHSVVIGALEGYNGQYIVNVLRRKKKETSALYTDPYKEFAICFLIKHYSLLDQAQ